MTPNTLEDLIRSVAERAAPLTEFEITDIEVRATQDFLSLKAADAQTCAFRWPDALERDEFPA